MPDLMPPTDVDAEAQVLSALLCAHTSVAEADGLDTALCVLKPEHFSQTEHRRIFEAVAALEAANRAVDQSAVAAWLKDHSLTVDPVYLRQLIDDVPATVFVEDCTRRIRDKWRMRQLISTCQRVAAEGCGHVDDVAGFVDKAESAIAEISTEREARQPEHVSEIIRTRFQDLQARVADGGGRMILTGLHSVDKAMVGALESDLVCIAARPGIGKTAFAVNTVAAHTAERGMGVAVFSLEMPRAQLIDRLICADALVDSRKIVQGGLTADDWSRMASSAARISKLPIVIDDEGGISLSALRAKLRRMTADLRRRGSDLKLVIVDYLQLMGYAGENAKASRDERVGENSHGLKALAKNLECTVLILSQLNREIEKRGKRGKPARPQMSDLRESGNIEQDCDMIMFLSPTSEDNVAEVIVAKSRHFGVGEARVNWRPQFTRFDDLEPGREPSWSGDDF